VTTSGVARSGDEGEVTGGGVISCEGPDGFGTAGGGVGDRVAVVDGEELRAGEEAGVVVDIRIEEEAGLAVDIGVR
jgi:hypothetical protein